MRSGMHFKFIVLIVAALLALFCIGQALAEQAQPPVRATLPPGYKYDESKYRILLYESNEYVSDVKRILLDFGYYPKIENVSELVEKNYLDDLTMMAVKNCCDANPGLEYDDYGLLDSPTYWAIVNQSIIDLNAEPADAAPVGYQHISWGDTGEGVRHVQQRLHELNYLENFETDNAGMWVYGEKTRDALDAFLEANDNHYSQDENDGITVELQNMMDAEGLTPLITPEPSPDPSAGPTEKPSLGERMSAYWVSSTTLLGITMPTYVVWLIGLVLVVLIIVAFIHFFMPSSDDDKGRKGGARQLNFVISYDGNTNPYTCSIQKIVRIGRNVGSFPLNPEDSNISRRHCEIYFNDNKLMLRDYSSNGTYVNDKLVHDSECMLKTGDTLKIGEHTITITF